MSNISSMTQLRLPWLKNLRGASLSLGYGRSELLSSFSHHQCSNPPTPTRSASFFPTHWIIYSSAKAPSSLSCRTCYIPFTTPPPESLIYQFNITFMFIWLISTHPFQLSFELFSWVSPLQCGLIVGRCFVHCCMPKTKPRNSYSYIREMYCPCTGETVFPKTEHKRAMNHFSRPVLKFGCPFQHLIYYSNWRHSSWRTTLELCPTGWKILNDSELYFIDILAVFSVPGTSLPTGN